MRESYVSGSFYKNDPDALKKQIKDLFGNQDFNRGDKEIKGAVIPHAGYFFSGKCMAKVYREIAQAKFPDVYVIIGTNHNSYGTLINLDDWKTPFGIVKNYNIDLGLEKNNMKYEHSVEVQIPFLQFISQDKIKDLRILPIVTNNFDKELVKKIDKIKNKVVIASSDFTHYGSNYGYVPFTQNVKENLYNLDKKAIDFILKLDTEGFLKYSENKTICGKYAIAVTMELCKSKARAKFIDYYTSGDIINDYRNAVGYGGVVFV